MPRSWLNASSPRKAEFLKADDGAQLAPHAVEIVELQFGDQIVQPIHRGAVMLEHEAVDQALVEGGCGEFFIGLAGQHHRPDGMVAQPAADLHPVLARHVVIDDRDRHFGEAVGIVDDVADDRGMEDHRLIGWRHPKRYGRIEGRFKTSAVTRHRRRRPLDVLNGGFGIVEGPAEQPGAVAELETIQKSPVVVDDHHGGRIVVGQHRPGWGHHDIAYKAVTPLIGLPMDDTSWPAFPKARSRRTLQGRIWRCFCTIGRSLEGANGSFGIMPCLATLKVLRQKG